MPETFKIHEAKVDPQTYEEAQQHDELILQILSLKLFRTLKNQTEFLELPVNFENGFSEYKQKWEALFLYELYSGILCKRSGSKEEIY